jgi:hypothetical protein
LTSGGTVTNNNASASIEHGITISGGVGSVSNAGSIGAASTYATYGSDRYSRTVNQSVSRSIELTEGGTVTNGDAGSMITNGIAISGGAATVNNNGTIGGPIESYERIVYFHTYELSTSVGYSLALAAGGSVTNGGATNTNANIANGIVISGGAGEIVNDGTIGGPSSVHYMRYSRPIHYFSPGIHLSSGGTVTNGSDSDTSAGITNGILIDGTGAVLNFGAIDGTAAHRAGVALGSGTITNGSASDAAALIAGDLVGLSLSSGTVINWGTIRAARGSALVFNSSSCTLVEEGVGVISGKVKGGGGTLELAADGGTGTLSGLGTTITNFATTAVATGASWTFTGANTLSGTVHNEGSLANRGTLTNQGVLTNSRQLTVLGQVINRGSIDNHVGSKLLLEGDVGISGDPAGVFTNAGQVRKVSGTGTSVIRTGNTSLIDSGVIDIDRGILELAGKTISISGPIRGAGTIEFGVGLTTLAPGSSITTVGMTIAGTGADVTVTRKLGYTGIFSATTNTELSITSGNLFELSGTAAFHQDTIDGAGQLRTEGSTTANQVTLGGTAQWYNTGTLSLIGGKLTVGDNAGNVATFNNQATGVFDLVGNTNIALGKGASIFKNQGLVAKTAGSLSKIAIGVTNTGIIEVASGTLDLQGTMTGKGALKIDAGKVLQADAAVSQSQTVDFNGGGDKLVLTDAPRFAAKLQDFGLGDKLDLRQYDPTTTTLAFSENGTNTAGVLVATDGSLQAKITLLGQYAASAFHKASDGLGGTLVTYTPQAAFALASPHV